MAFTGTSQNDALPQAAAARPSPPQALCGPCARASAPVPGAQITRAGFVGAIDLCVRHLAAWLGGCPPPRERPDIDPAAESARVQLWKWLHCEHTLLDDGTPINFALFDTALLRVGERLPRRGLPGQENVSQAALLLAELTHARTLTEMLARPTCAHMP